MSSPLPEGLAEVEAALEFYRDDSRAQPGVTCAAAALSALRDYAARVESARALLASGAGAEGAYRSGQENMREQIQDALHEAGPHELADTFSPDNFPSDDEDYPPTSRALPEAAGDVRTAERAAMGEVEIGSPVHDALLAKDAEIAALRELVAELAESLCPACKGDRWFINPDGLTADPCGRCGAGAIDALAAETARREEAEERLSEFVEDFRRVINDECAPDEKHCSCVPHLRARLRRVEGAARDARERLDQGAEPGQRLFARAVDAIKILDAALTPPTPEATDA